MQVIVKKSDGTIHVEVSTRSQVNGLISTHGAENVEVPEGLEVIEDVQEPAKEEAGRVDDYRDEDDDQRN